MREEYGTVRIYLHIEVPCIYSKDKIRRARRTLHSQEGITKVQAADLYQSFMKNNRHRFKGEDVIFCIWQAEPSYISLTSE